MECIGGLSSSASRCVPLLPNSVTLTPLPNLGEAETIAIIESRYRNAAIFLTDDGDARAQARGRGIPVYTTAHILALYEVKGRITHDQAREYLALMRNHHQGIGMDARDYDAFVETLVNRYAEPRCQNN